MKQEVSIKQEPSSQEETPEVPETTEAESAENSAENPETSEAPESDKPESESGKDESQETNISVKQGFYFVLKFNFKRNKGNNLLFKLLNQMFHFYFQVRVYYK